MSTVRAEPAPPHPTLQHLFFLSLGGFWGLNQSRPSLASSCLIAKATRPSPLPGWVRGCGTCTCTCTQPGHMCIHVPYHMHVCLCQAIYTQVEHAHACVQKQTQNWPRVSGTRTKAGTHLSWWTQAQPGCTRTCPMCFYRSTQLALAAHADTHTHHTCVMPGGHLTLHPHLCTAPPPAASTASAFSGPRAIVPSLAPWAASL